MGNAGSAQNIQNNCTESDLASYYTTQYLRRTTGETKKKHNQDALGGWSSGRNMAECKVLPKPTENLKLRATTNGAILQAGGTISFRAKEPTELERTSNAVLEHKRKPASFQPMRRCHTLILDGQNDSTSHSKSARPLAEFRRAQTLLHVGYNRNKSCDTSVTNSETVTQTPTANACTSTLKVNKYNKKRRAPSAPTKISLGIDHASSGQNLSVERKNTSLVKPRIYAMHSNKTQALQKKQLQPTHKLLPQSTKITPFQRHCEVRTSVNSSRAFQQSNSSSKFLYRREKSFDAVILRHRETNDWSSDERALAQNPSKPRQRHLPIPQVAAKAEGTASRNSVGTNGKKELLQQLQNVGIGNKSSNIYLSGTNYLRATPKAEEPFRQEESLQFNLSNDKIARNTNNDGEREHQSNTNERKPKYQQQSRIPQLKRTFYFGMETPSKSPTKNSPCRGEKLVKDSDNIAMLNHSIQAEEEIVDNGILVHVRPTLPRRQPEKPSFSPAAAWRNLLEQQQCLQQESTKSKHIILNSQLQIESPICLTSKPKTNYASANANWTPQQDLEDDDDEDDEEGEEEKCNTTKLVGKEGTEAEKHSNALHIFSLSLPRDVHLQCQMKSSLDYTDQQNSLKTTNCWLVPGFNSLQKFRPNAKCTCAPNTTIKRNGYHLQNIFGDSLTADWKSHHHHQPDCELNKSSSPRPPSCHNDNWLLHKSKSNDTPLAAITKTTDDSCLKSFSNAHSLVNLQPKSLTNICGGKHIVYLPGQDAFKAYIKDGPKDLKQTKATKSTYKRQRQRQEIIRESLQDSTPLQSIHQSNVQSGPEKNTHRFSFQSTVRVLEKRRLAEKLSKDAEIQEAQRLNELEVMKRVEEDFQRKRAPEKANLRNQLRLHLKANTENEEYRSLPLNINERYNSQQQELQHISDVNNNLFCRAEPDGAVSPPLDFNDNLPKTTHSKFPLTPTKSSKNLGRYIFDGEESESETQVPDLQHTALLIEPYLHSII